MEICPCQMPVRSSIEVSTLALRQNMINRAETLLKLIHVWFGPPIPSNQFTAVLEKWNEIKFSENAREDNSQTPQTTERQDSRRQLMGLDQCLDGILDQLAIHEVVAVSATDSFLRSEGQSYIRRRLHCALKPWFDDPFAFRKVMKDTNAIITGSFSLAFCLAEPWEPGDLNIYVPGGWRRHGERLKSYLKNVEHYKATPESTWPPDLLGYTGVVSVSRFEKVHPGPDGSDITSVIELVETFPLEPYLPILQAPCTIQMTWIGHDYVFMAYPKLTYQRIGVLNPAPAINENRLADFCKKYQLRGYTLVDSPGDLNLPCGDACPSMWRSIGDVACLEMHFEEKDGDTKTRGAERRWATWTLTANGNMPQAQCKNAFCRRSPLMLNRRDTVLPITPLNPHPTILTNSPPIPVHSFDLSVD